MKDSNRYFLLFRPRYTSWFFNELVAVLILALPSIAKAADIAVDVQNGLNFNENGGYIELSLAGGYVHRPYKTMQEQKDSGVWGGIELTGVIRKSDFFIEAIASTQDGLNLGYTAYQNKSWTIDLLAASMNRPYETDLDNKIREGDDEETRNRKLYDRHSFYLGTGIRITRYIDDYVIQYRLVTDTFSDNGITSTLRLGRGWQYRNWNFYSVLSANYSSSKTNNYWFGVDSHEATTRYPEYSTGSSLYYGIQFGLVKPISEKWIARGFTGWIQTPNEARKSPFVTESDLTYFVLAVSRVFSWGN